MNGILRTGALSAVAMLTGLALLGWTYGPANEAPAAAPTVDECEATFDPDSVEHGSEETLEVSFSESIGMVESVEADPDSGLYLEWVNHQEEEEPQEGEVRVSATDAEMGTWEVTFEGDEGECHGEITVENSG